MPYQDLFQVDVPTHHDRNPALHGVHVFTGEAASSLHALQLARQVYDQAFAALEAGRQLPDAEPGAWAARGLRPGWELDWSAAKVCLWVP
ncbi:hypothetical protein [Streptomyces cadmiisoli]|uniref:hypothetical protein n=1 Tax=Streptomyces cadmiisoli TaxID=2184053 RepID=UPI003654776F